MGVATYEAIVDDVELISQWRALGFASSDAWLTWRLAALGVPASVHEGVVSPSYGHLTIERLPDRAATRYAWSPGPR